MPSLLLLFVWRYDNDNAIFLSPAFGIIFTVHKYVYVVSSDLAPCVYGDTGFVISLNDNDRVKGHYMWVNGTVCNLIATGYSRYLKELCRCVAIAAAVYTTGRW